MHAGLLVWLIHLYDMLYTMRTNSVKDVQLPENYLHLEDTSPPFKPFFCDRVDHPNQFPVSHAYLWASYQNWPDVKFKLAKVSKDIGHEYTLFLICNLKSDFKINPDALMHCRRWRRITCMKHLHNIMSQTGSDCALKQGTTGEIQPCLHWVKMYSWIMDLLGKCQGGLESHRVLEAVLGINPNTK